MSQFLSKTIVFLLTFLAYAGLHSLREGWSYTKPQIQKEFDIDRSLFGLIDTLYLVSYSIGMATLGNLSKRIPLNRFVAIGMILATLCYLAFPIAYQINGFYSYPFIVVMMCFNGFFQSTGWPGVMGIVGNWFGKGKRGLLMGIWAINANIGNIIAELLCNLLEINYELSWVYNFISTGVLTIVIAILVLLFLKNSPQKEKSQIPETEVENLDQSMIQSENGQTQKKPEITVNVFSAICLPRVPYYVVGYACLKGCIYGLLFWLPSYLDDQNLNDQKGYISAMVDIGSFIGGLIVGHLGDKFQLRALFLTPLLIISSGIMFIVSFALTDIAWMYYIAMFGIGITIGGPYNIIGSAITIDLGQQTGGKNVAAVSALIQGSAAVFAAVSQIIISVLPFTAIFYLFCGQCLFASLALLPLFLKDYSQLKKRKQEIVE